MMWRIRRWVYRMGFRPGLGSIFHSPTLHWHYAFRNFGRDFEIAFRKAQGEMNR